MLNLAPGEGTLSITLSPLLRRRHNLPPLPRGRGEAKDDYKLKVGLGVCYNMCVKLISMCKSKIHRATVTCCDVDYVGSVTIDSLLMDAAGIIDGEKVHVWNVTNGERLETYAIPAEPGSGIICLNGAAAHRCGVGDKVILATFCLTDEPVERKVVLVDENNRITNLI